MADIIDEANEHAAREALAREAAIRAAAANMPTGVAGECDFCGEWTGRLVGGACARCRDARGLQ